MNARAIRTALVLLAALPVAAVCNGALVLLPFSLDTGGDLRAHFDVDRRGQLTFAGLAPGSPAPPGLEELLYRRWRADFGTSVVPSGRVEDGRVDYLLFSYEGNPLAMARLAARWRGVFARGEARCRWTWCSIDAPGERGTVTAMLSTEYAWYGPSAVTVMLRGD